MSSLKNNKRGKPIEDGLKLTSLDDSAKSATETQDEVVDALCEKYSINPQFKSKLNQLQEYKVIMIADDSGSMIQDSDANLEGVRTRWDELQLMLRLSVELYSPFNPNGMDIYFLNQEEPITGVKSASDKRLTAVFKRKPLGPTPICKVLRKVLKNDNANDLPRIIVIATDGEPTAMDARTSEIDLFRHILINRNTERNFVSIVACTGDDAVLAYLNRWDVEIANLDVVDDYRSERLEVLRAQGSHFGFNYTDYVIKLMLGAVDPYFDRLDEMTAERRAALIASNKCNCTLL